MAAVADCGTADGSSEPRSTVAAGDTQAVRRSLHLASADVDQSFVVARTKKESSATINSLS